METPADLIEFCIENKRFPSRKEQGPMKSLLRRASMMGFTEGLPLEAVESLEMSCEQVAKIVLQRRREYDVFLTERLVCRKTGALPENSVALKKIFRKRGHPLAKEFRKEFPELANTLRSASKKPVDKEAVLTKSLRVLYEKHGSEVFVGALSRVLVEALQETN